MLTDKQKRELKALDEMPDDQIDFSDAPEATEEKWKTGFRGMTKHISLRVSASDLEMANKLAAAKGLPYQTYIKSLLHESLVAENARFPLPVQRDETPAVLVPPKRIRKYNL